MSKREKPHQTIPEPVDLDVPHKSYQPTAKEKHEEIDMPGLSPGRIRDVFMRPFRLKQSK